MPPNHFESEVESFLEGSHGDRTHIKRADHHTVTPLCGTLLMVAVQGRALVMVVSRWPASVAAVVSLVASSPRGCVLCAKKFALRGLVVGVSAKKFALHAQNTPKSAFLRLLGELICGRATRGAVLGELFCGNAAGGAVLGEFFADRQSWDPTGRVVLRRGPGSLPRQPPVGLTCA